MSYFSDYSYVILNSNGLNFSLKAYNEILKAFNINHNEILYIKLVHSKQDNLIAFFISLKKPSKFYNKVSTPSLKPKNGNNARFSMCTGRFYRLFTNEYRKNSLYGHFPLHRGKYKEDFIFFIDLNENERELDKFLDFKDLSLIERDK